MNLYYVWQTAQVGYDSYSCMVVAEGESVPVSAMPQVEEQPQA